MDTDVVGDTLQQLTGALQTYVPNILGAIVILVVGWLIAKIASAIVRSVLRRTGIDSRANTTTPISQTSGKVVFYVIMLMVLVAFFQVLKLTLIVVPLNSLLNQIFSFLPQLIGAGVLLLVAWVVATVLRLLVRKGLETANIDQRLSQEGEEPVPLTQSLSEAVYWLVFLFFLPGILTALELDGLLTPVQGMLDKILNFLPNLVTAGILLLIGWFIARLVQRIISSLLAAAGADRLSERIGLASVLGEMQLSGLVGNIVYVFILLPVVISALNTLQLDSITAPASAMLSQILLAIPNIFAAAVILGMSYAIGKLVAGLVTSLLAGIGVDRIGELLGLGGDGKIGGKAPSEILGSLVMLAIMLFATTEALGILGFEAIGALVTVFINFAGHILFGLVILGIGIYIANAVAKAVRSTETASATLLAGVARWAILLLAGSMALNHMGLANEIINTAFGLLLGAAAVAVAIAFGLGGRDAAAQQLEDWKNKLNS